MEHNINPLTEAVFQNYPDVMKNKLYYLRKLILQTAEETEGVTKMEETLKWGEPAYMSNIGSTIRIDWKKRSPDQYAMYFNCKSMLIDTFKVLFENTFHFEGNRAIIFQEKDAIPVKELKYCIMLALSYHKRKHLPMLGA